MTYVEFIKASIMGDKGLFSLAEQGKARGFVIINLIILGLFFGLSEMAGVAEITPGLPLSGKFAVITPLIFAFTGTCSMIIAVAGITLVCWAAAKALGGPGGLGAILDLLGLSLLPFWFLAPLLNYTIRFHPELAINPVLAIAVLLLFGWSFVVLKSGFRKAQHLSPAKAVIAVTSVWIFSISAVYVFIP